MSDITATDGVGIRGRVEYEAYDAEDLRAAHPEWDEHPEGRKLDILAWLADEPVATGETENLILDAFLAEHARGNAELPYLAVGDRTAVPEPDNTELNNEVWRTQVGRDEGSGAVRLTSTLLAAGEANGSDIAEIGFANDESLLTHTVLAAGDRIEDKSAALVVVIYYELVYQRPSS